GEATATRLADARGRVGRGSGALASGLTGALAGGLTGVAVLDELRARIACELLGVGLLVTDLERGMLHRCGRRRCRRIGGGGETGADDGGGGEYGDDFHARSPAGAGARGKLERRTRQDGDTNEAS